MYNVIFFFCINLLFHSNLYSHDCIAFSEAKSILNGHPKEAITEINEDITLEEAYCAQEKINYLLKKEYNDVIGYKVGFTGNALQKRFNINTPARGTLYKHMFLSNNSSISKDFGFRTFIEPDILVIIKNSNIMSAKTDLDLLEGISSIHPFLEIPALRYKEDQNINGNMLIAANMLATKMVMAEEGIVIESTLEGVEKISSLITILKDNNNNIIQSASTENLMGNPLKVLKWLIDDLNSQKLSLKKGDRISLGSVRKLYPLVVNKYKYFFKGFEDDKNIVKITVN